MEAKAPWLLTLVAAMLASTMGSSYAYDFYVGGRQGWVPNPSESYTDWAGRNRFQVNDRLVFRYNKGEDSVLVVSEPDFRACNTANPIRRLDGGDSVFQLDRSGPFYFISGVPGRCQGGEKLAVVVLAVRRGRMTPAAPALPPAAPPPSAPGPSPPPSPAPPTSPPPAGAGGRGEVPSAPPTGVPASERPPAGPGQVPPSGSASLGVPFGTAVATLALAGAALLSI